MPIASLTAKRTAAYFATLTELPRTVLDVAAGHGLYGIELAKMLPRALVTAVDCDIAKDAGFSGVRARLLRPTPQCL
jgi:methylase of polypeptide subunit release factors